MATPIKRIEKDFLLKVLYDEQILVMMFHNRVEYTITVDQAPKQNLVLKSNQPIPLLREGHKLGLMFDYRGQVITFSVQVLSIKEDIITTEAPEFLYKNLARSYSRVSSPRELKIKFTFHGDRYDLSFPKIQEYEQAAVTAAIDQGAQQNIKELISQLASWVQETATGYKLSLFKDTQPSTTEERLLSETGKTFFIPSTETNLPEVDPYPKKRIVTADIFKRFLESSGIDKIYVDDAVVRFIQAKRESGIYSDAWVPILFQEYVVGYIHIWVGVPGRPPFDYSIVDTLYQFAKVLAFSLKEHGYFEAGKVKKEAFRGKVVDISASGMLFAYPNSPLSTSLLPDCELDIQIETPKRIVRTGAKIVRRYRDSSTGYFGCRFLDTTPEDLRFLFEYIYGRPFTDQDANFLVGNV